MDAEYEDRLRCDLLEAYNGGKGKAYETEIRANILAHRMRDDEDAARFHLSAVVEVAQSSLPVPAAHMILHDCYLRGWAVTVIEKQALQHLEFAIDDGADIARWYLGCYLLKDSKLASVLDPNPERALDIFRDLARNARDTHTLSLSIAMAASQIINRTNNNEVTNEDREIVGWYAGNLRRVRPADYHHLALFYAERGANTDTFDPDYSKVREILIAGTKTGSETVSKACKVQLEKWGGLPSVESQSTAPPKPAVGALKTTGMLGGVLLIVGIWSVIGIVLSSIAAAINAMIIPIILVVVCVGLAVSLIRRS